MPEFCSTVSSVDFHLDMRQFVALIRQLFPLIMIIGANGGSGQKGKTPGMTNITIRRFAG
ncbi:hypothetical protein SAMN05216316_1841 [Nitrosovibrio sp. Nv6]|nr:hypothetical protein SAMN05216316_1841 [Nitrosovibrio sp. Nv6]